MQTYTQYYLLSRFLQSPFLSFFYFVRLCLGSLSDGCRVELIAAVRPPRGLACVFERHLRLFPLVISREHPRYRFLQEYHVWQNN